MKVKAMVSVLLLKQNWNNSGGAYLVGAGNNLWELTFLFILAFDNRLDNARVIRP